MSTLVLLPGAGSAPAIPVLGPWVTIESGRPGAVVGRAVPTASVASSVTTGSVVGRMRWSSVSSDWEVKL